MYNPSRRGTLASGSDVSACPFRLSTGGFRRSGGNEARRLVGPCDHVDCFRTDANGVGYADEDSSYDTNAPNEELTEGCCPLVDCDVQWIELKLEEDSWRAPAMVDLPSVMGDTILVRTQRPASGWDVCCRDDVKEVLISDERFKSKLKRVVQRLSDVGKVRAKREFCNNVRQIHQTMVDVLTAGIAVSKGCNMQVRCDFLHSDGPKYATGTSIRAIIIGWFKRRGVAAKDGVQETTGFTRLSNRLVNREGSGVLLQQRCLADVK